MIQPAKPQQKCPTPQKTNHATKGSALRSMRHSWRKMYRSSYPLRVYLCRCGSWHLTSKPRLARPDADTPRLAKVAASGHGDSQDGMTSEQIEREKREWKRLKNQRKRHRKAANHKARKEQEAQERQAKEERLLQLAAEKQEREKQLQIPKPPTSKDSILKLPASKRPTPKPPQQKVVLLADAGELLEQKRAEEKLARKLQAHHAAKKKRDIEFEKQLEASSFPDILISLRWHEQQSGKPLIGNLKTETQRNNARILRRRHRKIAAYMGDRQRLIMQRAHVQMFPKDFAQLPA